MNCRKVHSVWALIWCPRKLRSGAQTLCIAIVLLAFASRDAQADCPTAPTASADDMVVSFLASNGVQAASGSLLTSTVKEGMLVYDATADKLKVCDGTNWVDVGSGSGTDTLASLSCASGEIAKYDGTAWACAPDGSGGSPAPSDGYVQFNNAGAFGGDANLFWDNTNKRIGIGTFTPEARISLVDETNAGWTYKQYSDADGTNFRNYRARGSIAAPSAVQAGDRLASFLAGGYGDTQFSSPNGGLNIYAAENFTDTAAGTYVTLSTAATGTNPAGGGTERLRVTADGNVGIGTTTPQSVLQVAGGIQLGDDTATCPGASDVKLGTLRFNGGDLQICKSGGWSAIGSGDSTLPAGNDGSIQFKSGSILAADAANLHWDDTNNRLGMGTTSPLETLHVNGMIKSAGIEFPQAWGRINWNLIWDGTGWDYRSTGYGGQLQMTDLGRIDFLTYATGTAGADTTGQAYRMSILNNGNVGIGTTAPDARLNVTNTPTTDWTYGVKLDANGAFAGETNKALAVTKAGVDQHVFYPSGKATLAVNGGNVGIGTTTPQSLLHVAGGVQLGDDTATCPGAGNIKLGTLRFNGGNLQVCRVGGWTALHGSGGGSNTMHPNFPDAIRCTDGAETRTFLLTIVDATRALYRDSTAGANDTIQFNPATGAYATQSGYGSSDCVTGTKSIATLYAEGKAFNFVGGATASAAGTSGQIQFNEGGNLKADAALHWDNVNKRLGIGTTTPARLLHVGAADGVMQVGNAYSALISGDDGGNAVYGNNMHVGADGALKQSYTHATYGLAGIHESWGTIDFYTRAGATTADAPLGVTPRMRIDSAGNVGIGTATPNQGKLEVKGGSVCVDTNSDDNATSCITAESDVRLKKNIEAIPHALATLEKLRGVLFDWRWDEYPAIADYKAIGRDAGVIAQEVETAFPQGMGEELNGFKTVRYDRLVPLLIESVKELKADNDNLRAELKSANDNDAGQDAALEDLRREINSLKAAR